jgi:hypothetical protein
MLSGKDAQIKNTGVPINAHDDFSFRLGKWFRHRWLPSNGRLSNHFTGLLSETIQTLRQQPSQGSGLTGQRTR